MNRRSRNSTKRSNISRSQRSSRRCLRLETLELRQLLAVDVAIVYDQFGDTGGYTATRDQLANDTFADFNASLVSASALTTQNAFSSYDVIVIGGDGNNNALANTSFASALSSWVNSGGGVVMTGFGIFGSSATSSFRSILDSTIPIQFSAGWGFSGASNFSPDPVSGSFTASTHEITNNVGSFSIGMGSAPTEWSQSTTISSVLDSGATLLGTLSGRVTGAAATKGSGRGVWLGPAYTANSIGWGSLTTSLRSGNADRLLEQAVLWAGSAPASILDVVDVSPDPRNSSVNTVDVTFSRAINAATFNGSDITLSRNGGSNLVDGGVSVSLLSGNTYRISNLVSLTAASGTYSITVNGAGITDTSGNTVSGSATDSWLVDLTPPTVTTTSFLSNGNLATSTTSLSVTFSESLVGAGIPANYELRRAGTDGLLGNADDPLINITSVPMLGNTATLNFAALPEDVYRFVVKNSVMDIAGNALDGDVNGTPGGNWSKDFVVGALHVPLTSTNGFVFDPEFGGLGAGQLVQGTNGAFDGLGRLLVNGTAVVPETSTIELSESQENRVSSGVTYASGNYFTIQNGSGGTLQIAASATGMHRLSASLDVFSFNANQVVIEFLKNGVPTGERRVIGISANSQQAIILEDYTTLSAGDFVSLRILTNSNVIVQPDSILRIIRMVDIPGAGPSVTVAENRVSSSVTYASSNYFTIQNGSGGTLQIAASATGMHRLSASLDVFSFNANQVVIEFLKNGVPTGERRVIGISANSQQAIILEDYTTLSAGDFVSLRILTNSNVIVQPDSILRIIRMVDIPGAGPSVTVAENRVSSSVTYASSNYFTIQNGSGGTLQIAASATGMHRLSASLDVFSFNANQVVIEFLKNGVPTGERRVIGISANSQQAIILEDYTTLSAGDFVSLRILTNSNVIVQPDSILRIIRTNSAPIPLTRDSSRTVTTNPASIGGISVQRSVTVPASGLADFVRMVDTFSNPSGNLIPVTASLIGNLGSDGTTTLFATSDGDLFIEPTDLWFGTDDADGTGTPAIIHLLHGVYGLRPSSVNVIDDNVEWTYDLTVPAGTTRRLANFTVLGTTRAEALAAANALVTTTGFGGEAAAFLTTEELASLANFQFNASPTDISLNHSAIDENQPAGTAVGTFSSSDPNPGSTFTYSLVSGTGDTDNASFLIDGDVLKSLVVFDAEIQGTYSIRVRSTDNFGAFLDKVLSISVNDLPTVLKNLNFVGQLRTSTTDAVLQGDHAVTYTLYSSASGGSPLLSAERTVNASSVVGGYFQQQLAELFPLTGLTTETFLEVAVDGFVMPGRIKVDGGSVSQSAGGITLKNALLTAETIKGDDVVHGLHILASLRNNDESPVLGSVNWTVQLFNSQENGIPIYSDSGSLTATDSIGGAVAITLGQSSPLESSLLSGAVWAQIAINGENLPARVRVDGGGSRMQSASYRVESLQAVRSSDTEPQTDYPIGTVNLWMMFRDASYGQAITGDRQFTVSVFGAELGGVPVFSESRQITIHDTIYGSYVHALGSENALDLDIFKDYQNLWLEVTLDGETQSSRQLLSRSSFLSLITLRINEPASSVTLQNVISTLSESASTVSSTKVADILVADDGLGTNTLTLTGADADYFEIVGNELRLKAGVALDFESKPNYLLTINVDDTTVGASPDAFTNFQLTLTNVDPTTPIDSDSAENKIAKGVSAGAPVGITAFASDPQGPNVIYSLTNDAGGRFSIDANSGVVKVANANLLASRTTYTVSVQASDGAGGVSSASFAIEVINSAAPIAQDILDTTHEDSSKDIVLIATDANNDSLAYTVINQPLHGTLTGTAPNLIYVPNPNYFGSDSFTYLANDGELESNVATVSLTVLPVNDAPTVVNPIQDLVVAESAGTVQINLANVFADIDDSSFTLTASTSNASLVTASVVDGIATLTFAPGMNGVASITINASDSGNLSVSDEFSITVLNSLPTLTVSSTLDGNSGVTGQDRVLRLTATDATDNGARPFTYEVLWGDGSPLEALSAPSVVDASHAYATTGPKTVQVRTIDPDGGASAWATRTLNILSTEVQGNVLAIGGNSSDDVLAFTPGANAPAAQVLLNAVSLSAINDPSGGIKFFGGSGNDSLIMNGTAGNDTFTTDGASIVWNGSATWPLGVRLDSTGVEKLRVQAQAGNDEIVIASGAAEVDGGTGTDRITGPNSGGLWNVTGAGIGALNGLSFLGIETVLGGSSDDNFVFGATGAFTGIVDGNGGQDTLNFSAKTTAITISLLANTSTSTGGIRNFEQFIGGSAATDTFTAANTANAWQLTGQKSGLINLTIGFSDFETLKGGTSTDSFAIATAASSFASVDGGSGSDSLNYSEFSTSIQVDLASKSAPGIASFVGFESLIGSSTNDLLVGPNSVNTWTINGPNSGALGTTLFQSFESIQGGTLNDTVTLTATGGLTGSVDGATGTDTLVGPTLTGVNVDWTIASTGGGAVNSVNFLGMENLTGGSSLDRFLITDSGSIVGTINGGISPTGQRDQLNYAAVTTPISINLAANAYTNVGLISGIEEVVGTAGVADAIRGANVVNAWSITGVDTGTVGSVRFVDIENLTGGILADSFSLVAGGSVRGTIVGGEGTDTLVGPTPGVGSVIDWNITSVGGGDVLATDFAEIENLTGGNNLDRFIFSETGSVTGTINGGSSGVGERDQLNYSSTTGPIVIDLAAKLQPRAGLLVGIEEIIGTSSSQDEMRGANAANAWSITGFDTGTVGSVRFVGVENLTGGTLADSFTLANGGSIRGLLTGGDGIDTLVGPTPGVGSVIDWNITTAGGGDVLGVNFVEFENLTGGSNLDRFMFSETGSVTGTINGGSSGVGERDQLNYSSTTGPIVVDLAAKLQPRAGLLVGIEEIIGTSSAEDEIRGANVANAWSITGIDTGTVGSIRFVDIENLTGGILADSFSLVASGSVRGTIVGGDGADTVLGPTPGVGSVIDWNITSVGGGEVLGTDFAEIENLTGGNNLDRFTFSETGSVSGTINGGSNAVAERDQLNYSLTAGPIVVDLAAKLQPRAGLLVGIEEIIGTSSAEDEIRGANVANAWSLTGTDTGTVGILRFVDIENLTGGILADSFSLVAGGSVRGTMRGGAGIDTLTGANANTVWQVQGENTGLINAIAYQQIENLTGGSAMDTFVMSSSGSVSGVLNAGTGTTDRLDYSVQSSILIVNLQTRSLSGGGTFTGVEQIVGSFSGGDLLIGPDATTAWALSGVNLGTAGAIQFSGFESVQGGSGNDTFTLGVAGAMDGVVLGGGGTDTLVGPSPGLGSITEWNINSFSGGNLRDVDFEGIENLTGGNNLDRFLFSATGAVTGTINGGASGAGERDQVSYAAVVGPITIDLQAKTQPRVTLLVGIEELVGTDASDDLRGLDAANIWSLTAANTGTVGTFRFVGFESLVGGILTDTFSFVAGGTATSVDGGAGIDTILGPNAATNWDLQLPGQGTIGSSNFVAIENLTGGTAVDTFNIGPSGSLAGALNGGTTGRNVLSYAAWSSQVVVDLATKVASGITGQVTNFTIVQGGSGNDNLKGNATLGTLLLGMDGNDDLLGISGRDIMIGGFGSDTLTGGNGDDLLIAGATVYDNDFVSLSSIFDEWSTTSRNYQTRVNNLRGIGTEPRLNGNLFLQNSPTPTLYADPGSVDRLIGGLGQDWFITDDAADITDQVLTGLLAELRNEVDAPPA